MTSPLYTRNAAHERAICLRNAEYHESEAAVTEGEDRADHLRAAKACRDRAEEWIKIGQRAATMRGRK